MNLARPITCCKDIPSHATPDVAETVVGQMLITDYYDGATSGFLQCSVCQAVYHFVTVDWSDNHLVRVIALSLVPADSMARLVSFFSEAPPRTHWIPQILQRATEHDLDRIDAFLSDIISRAEPPSIVLAWNVMTKEILSARRVSPASADRLVSLFDADAGTAREGYDWFRDLGVARNDESSINSPVRER